MTSLSERLAAVGDEAPANQAVGDEAHARRTPPSPPSRTDELKANVHSELLSQLGPQLYDANLSIEEVESKVRSVLAEVMAADPRPITAAERQKITQEIADDILGYGPIEPYLRDPD